MSCLANVSQTTASIRCLLVWSEVSGPVYSTQFSVHCRIWGASVVAVGLVACCLQNKLNLLEKWQFYWKFVHDLQRSIIICGLSLVIAENAGMRLFPHPLKIGFCAAQCVEAYSLSGNPWLISYALHSATSLPSRLPSFPNSCNSSIIFCLKKIFETFFADHFTAEISFFRLKKLAYFVKKIC